MPNRLISVKKSTYSAFQLKPDLRPKSRLNLGEFGKLGLDLLHKAAEKGNLDAIALLTTRYLDRKGEDLVLKAQVKKIYGDDRS